MARSAIRPVRPKRRTATRFMGSGGGAVSRAFSKKEASPKDERDDRVDVRQKDLARLKRLDLHEAEHQFDWAGYPDGSNERVDGHPAYGNGKEGGLRDLFEKGAFHRMDGPFPQDDGKACRLQNTSARPEARGKRPDRWEPPI